jgi:hypothetical protein
LFLSLESIHLLILFVLLFIQGDLLQKGFVCDAVHDLLNIRSVGPNFCFHAGELFTTE